MIKRKGENDERRRGDERREGGEREREEGKGWESDAKNK